MILIEIFYMLGFFCSFLFFADLYFRDDSENHFPVLLLMAGLWPLVWILIAVEKKKQP